ncbi:Ubiquitin-fold modifier-conjugating enzyme [Sesbania bispinosa]|nr:Ubiquitin-fold modifier-conjugating enzyme [Sesbania bispinosa]
MKRKAKLRVNGVKPNQTTTHGDGGRREPARRHDAQEGMSPRVETLDNANGGIKHNKE